MKSRLAGASVVAAVLLLSAITASAYEYPSVERGFKPERAFQVGDIDNIRLFNGGLELVVPIGQRFPVGGGFSYGLTLSYSSQLWEYNPTDPPPGQQPLTQAWPVRGSNAGLGWRLSLGEFWGPTVSGPGTCINCYVSPDGAKHRFYNTLHPDLPDDGPTMYTRDGTYLRLRQVTGGWEIDFPTGEIHKFDASGRLTQMRDRFGNRVDVAYGASSWTLTDTQGRSHTVNFVSKPYYGPTVSSVVLGAFGRTQATYSFTYTSYQVPRSCLDTDPQTSQTINVPLLTKVGLPDGSSYSMPVSSYELTSGFPCTNYDFAVPLEGLLEEVTLPTLGKVEWSYGAYNFPVPIEGDPGDLPDPLWLQKAAGVVGRALRGRSGVVHGSWSYAQELPGGQKAAEAITRVTSPLGDRTDHYFRVGDEPDPMYGLPFSPLETAPGRPDLFRSTRIYDCGSGGTNCQLERTTYLKYKTDSPFPGGPEFNPRVEASYATFHDDGGRWAAVDHSSFDGLGHHRSATTSGNFGSGDVKSTFTNFNGTRGTYPGSFSMPAPGEPWVLETFDYLQVTEGGQTARQELCFEASTGYLLRSRVLKTGTSQGSDDLISVFTRDGNGNTIREQRYGADFGNVAAGALGNLCTLSSLGGEQYRVDHTYQFGVLATSQFYRANGNPIGFYSVNRTIDKNTGLVSSSLDPALVSTTFGYDALGRLTEESPDDDAKTTYTYTRATASADASVEIKRIQNGGSAVLAEEELIFDSFGRLAVERRRMPSGLWSKRTTFYYATGWRSDLSEWETAGQGHTAWTKFRDYDPFGRVGRIEPPDGGAHDIQLSYFGTRVVVRKVDVATGAGGAETEVTTTERYDRQGRLYQVTEPSGASGATVTTTYGYDEGNRLSSVSAGSTQSRSFSYDNRGFLTNECHPEKGVAGNGCVSYGRYNAWGLPGRKTDGPNDLRLLYDAAGRLTDIEEWGGGQRQLKHWEYGTGTVPGNRSNGKVRIAERSNHVVLGAIPYTVLVRETYTYGGLRGRVSSRKTESQINGGTPDVFHQSFGYDQLGNVASLGYPYRQGLPVGRTVTFGYTRGALTSIPGYAGSIGYHPNGMLSQIVHANGVTLTQAQDPDKMQRPASISTSGASENWSSGTYAFDGAGSPKTIGGSSFLYDQVGRLASAVVSRSLTGFGDTASQSYTYDRFGNILSITTNGVTRNTPTSSTTNRMTGSVAYDGAGNLTSYNGALYDYGPFNDMWRLRSGGEEWLHFYTADDERLWSYRVYYGSGPQENRWTLRDLGGKVLRQYVYDRAAFTWTVDRDYVHRGDQVLAAHTAHPAPVDLVFYHPDHLGSPRIITSATGERVAHHTYFPFGQEASNTNQNAERMKFTGHERDLNFHFGADPNQTAQDDLDYMHARFCSPVTGRFLTVDRFDVSRLQFGDAIELSRFREHLAMPQSWNRYTYARNSPLRYIDPDGEEAASAVLTTSILVGEGGAAAVAGTSGLAAAATGAAVLGAGAVGYGVGTAIRQIPGTDEAIQGAIDYVIFSSRASDARDFISTKLETVFQHISRYAPPDPNDPDDQSRKKNIGERMKQHLEQARDKLKRLPKRQREQYERLIRRAEEHLDNWIAGINAGRK